MPKSKMWALNEQTGHIAIEEKWRFEIGTGSEHYWSWWEIQRGGWSDPLIDTGLLLDFKSSLQHLTAQLAVTLSLRQVPSHFKKNIQQASWFSVPILEFALHYSLFRSGVVILVIRLADGLLVCCRSSAFSMGVWEILKMEVWWFLCVYCFFNPL